MSTAHVESEEEFRGSRRFGRSLPGFAKGPSRFRSDRFKGKRRRLPFRGPRLPRRDRFGEPDGFEPEPLAGSEYIRWVQDCLNHTLGARLQVTGVIGPETRSAVRGFQRQQGLRVNGLVGPDTKRALRDACERRGHQPQSDEREDTMMQTSNNMCPKCHGAGELEWGEAEVPGLGELYGEVGLESPLNEYEEAELATELLSVSSEEELDQFLGKFFKRIGKGLRKAGRFVRGRVLPALGKGLKTIAKVALPIAGRVAGSFIPIPGVGTAIGGAVGTAISNALEMEFAELNQEDQEFEAAKRFVRIAGMAAQQAAMSSPDADAESVVNEAIVQAARKHLPHLRLTESQRGGLAGRAQQGQWIRRGNNIVVLGG